MDKLDNIDDLFAKLNNDEKQTPAGVWEYILADQKRKKRAGVLWWYYGSAGLLLVAGLMGYYQFKKDKKHLQAYTIAKAFANNDLAASNNTDANNNAVAQTPDTLRLSAVNNMVYYTAEVALAKYKEYANTTEHIVDRNSGMVEPDMKNIIKPNDVVTRTANMEYEKAEAPPTDIRLNKKDLSKEKEEKDKTIRKTPNSKSQKYFVEVALTANRSYRTLSGDASLSEHINQRNRSEVALITKPALAITVGKELNRNWNIQTGVLYNVQGLSASYTVSTAQRKVFVDIDPTLKKYDTTASYIYIQDSVYKLEKGISINGDQKYHYIRIPVLGEWKLETRKLTVYAGGGLSLNILLAARGDVQDYQSAQSGVFVPVTQLALQRVGCDFMGRAGVLMPIFGRPDMKVSFGFRGMFSPVSVFGKDVPLKQHNYSFALELGIRKMLK